MGKLSLSIQVTDDPDDSTWQNVLDKIETIYNVPETNQEPLPVPNPQSNVQTHATEIYNTIHEHIEQNDNTYLTELETLLSNSAYVANHSLRQIILGVNNPQPGAPHSYLVDYGSILFRTTVEGVPRILKIYGYNKLIYGFKVISEIAFQVMANSLNTDCNFTSPAIYQYGFVNTTFAETSPILQMERIEQLPKPYMFYFVMDVMTETNLHSYIESYTAPLNFQDSQVCQTVPGIVNEVKTCLENNRVYHNDFNYGNIYITPNTNPISVGLIDYGESSTTPSFDAAPVRSCASMAALNRKYRGTTAGGKTKKRRRCTRKTRKSQKSQRKKTKHRRHYRK